MSRMIFCLGFIFLASPVFAGTWLEKLDRFLWHGDASLNQAEDAYEAGRYEDAAKKFEAASRRRAPAYDQVYNSAVALYKDGKFEEAQKRFAEVEQSPDLSLKSRAAHNSGLSFVQQGKLEAARDELRKALSYDNANTIIQENLAWIEEQLKNKQEQKPPEDQQKTAQNDSKDDQKNGDQKDQSQQNADQKEAKNDSSKQDSQQQDGEGKSKNDPSQQGQGKEEQKTAGQNAEQKPGEKDQQGNPQDDQQGNPRDDQQGNPLAQQSQDEKKQEEKTEGTGLAQNQDEKASKDEARAKASGMTLQDMKIQDAERLLRSIDDKVGRYPLNSSGGPKDDGKNW